MSLDTPQFRAATEEADFLRNRLLNIQDKLERISDMGETHIDYLHTLYALIDKEHSIYTRLKLIDSYESRRAMEDLDSYKIIAFLPAAEAANMTPGELYPAIKEELIGLIKEVSGDDWHPEDFDIEADDW